uniref:MYM-type domain-containing protein n=1 Tax=viral metagenome TaxID=1070528 RepID=A0A6C0BN23_9ZZZZ
MTSLFISDQECYLNRDLKIVPRVQNCATYVRSKLNQHVTHQPLLHHPLFHNGMEWPQSCEIACWHDGETFDSTPIPIVTDYDQQLDLYSVYGVFCSPNCAFTYIIEQEPYLTTRRMLYMNHMLRNVFQIHSPVKPAPPRIRLQRFGGDLTIEQFRNNFHQLQIRVVKPPFLATSLCVESANNEQKEPNFLDDLQTAPVSDQGMFTQYLQSKQQKKPRKRKPKPSRRRSKATSSSSSSSSSSSGVNLSSFIKFRKGGRGEKIKQKQ